jgi:hypothetical protein
MAMTIDEQNREKIKNDNLIMLVLIFEEIESWKKGFEYCFIEQNRTLIRCKRMLTKRRIL